MLITPSSIAAIETTFSSLFQQGWNGAKPYWERLATKVPSTSRSQVYGAMQRVPKAREWLGPRLFHNILGHALTIDNKHFEDSIEVSRDDIEDDQLGWTNPVVQELGRQAAKWPDQLLRDQIQANPIGFDGLAMFHDAHTLDPSGTQDNNFALPLTPANYGTVRESVMSFRGEDSEPLGVVPGLLVVPPQLETEGRQILNADLIAVDAPGGGGAAVTNIFKGSADLLVVSELSNQPTTWYLFDVSRPLKPWIFQIRKEPEFVARTEITSDNVFNLNAFQWGVDMRGNVGPGPWFLGARSVG